MRGIIELLCCILGWLLRPTPHPVQASGEEISEAWSGEETSLRCSDEDSRLPLWKKDSEEQFPSGCRCVPQWEKHSGVRLGARALAC